MQLLNNSFSTKVYFSNLANLDESRVDPLKLALFLIPDTTDVVSEASVSTSLE